MTLEEQAKSQELQTLETIETEITYQVDQDIFLTHFRHSDTAEVYRILNINSSISEGLHSANMTFPYPEERVRIFIERNKYRARNTGSTANVWAIRESVQGPVIGLFALDPCKHREEFYTCTRDTYEPSTVPSLKTISGAAEAQAQKESISASVTNSNVTSTEPIEPTKSLVTEADQQEWLSCSSFGYWVSPEVSGRGIMTKVVTYGISQIARPVFGFERVHGECWTENTASRRVMEKSGMRSATGTPVFVPKFNKVKDIAHYIFDTSVHDP
ncbi:hypothetical protein BGW38_002928 [Lunasporangiospora selenospora]|uniref:N-acetyltransferase domain-containing protein n=1 Tax=Lunasporangiospora selenospora TaxID=979761 RepID=A0A9P6G0T9_9FUNG|nr:hypothetical protein BGW38_002928 [Lunasporangiospora selenospora]